jgi:signal peptidase II
VGGDEGVTRRVAVRFVPILALVIGADQATKAAVRAGMEVGESVPLIGRVLSLTHVSNTGAAFGLFRGNILFFIVMASAVLGAIAIVLWRYRGTSVLFAASLSLIFGGAAGNLIDRSVAGRVTDFIDVHIWPVFNVADIALNVGVALLILYLIVHRDEPADAAEAEPAGPKS